MLGYNRLMRHGFARSYFNLIYNRIYDRTTARLLRYVQVQGQLARCLDASEGQRALCVGLGTGNELTYLAKAHCGLDITGVDFSAVALRSARLKSSDTCALALMDAHSLGFAEDTFDRVLAYHVTDFLESPERATAEALRVLKTGGRFVISYPSTGEGAGLGAALIAHGIGKGAGSLGARIQHLFAALGTGLVYLPLAFRGGTHSYSRAQLAAMLEGLGARIQDVTEDAIYRDHIVCGTKPLTEGGRE